MTEPMQFDTNDDFPPNPCQSPVSFPDPVIGQCTRITTRIYKTEEDTITMARDCVLVPPIHSMRDNEDSASSSSTDRSTTSDDEDDIDDDLDDLPNNNNNNGDEVMDHEMMESNPEPSAPPLFSTTHEPRAYWIQRDIREAIFGRVYLGEVLKRRPNNTYVEWETTGVRCAIKEMSWEMIREQEHTLAENPVQEVAAMQYLQRFCFRNRNGSSPLSTREQEPAPPQLESNVHVTVQQMMDTKIMMSLDVLSDDRHLYSIMPYADGQELFDYVDEKGKFTEEESRYWILQILEGVESLQRAGVCHRDMSLENLLTDRQKRCLIIDMGMCLKIPYLRNKEGTELLTENRCLIQRQTRCGKWPYISPEILKNQEFDGHAVDMWAVGVILFMMVAGFPPWDRACDSDERFKYMSRGYTSQILTQWQLGLSPDLMDLMQRMFAINPKHRLSLQQVRAHPWMNGPVDVPL